MSLQHITVTLTVFVPDTNPTPSQSAVDLVRATLETQVRWPAVAGDMRISVQQ